MTKKDKKVHLTKFLKYNDFEKNNREMVEIDEQTYNSLPAKEKAKFKIVMTRDKSKVKPPKGQTDHDLLLMILKEIQDLKDFKNQSLKFQTYVLDMFKKHGWTK